MDYDYKSAMGNAAPISSVTSAWIGKSPNDLDDKIDSGACEEISMETIKDRKIVLFGYSLRDGMNDKQFAVICLVPEGETKIFVLVCGGGVIVNKLKKILPEGFPVSGTFEFKKNKKGQRYFDLV